MLLDTIHPVLQNYPDPYLRKTWGEVQVPHKITPSQHKLFLDISLGYPVLGLIPEIRSFLEKKLLTIKNLQAVEIRLNACIQSHAIQPSVEPIVGVKNIIAIASGKGGVGKSTMAINLAVALSEQGAQVGLLDADIYGPNQPQMLGSSTTLKTENGKQLSPVLAHGLQTMSMAYLISPETPMIWRGPMVSSALQQLARNTAWHDLDYLIVDLPPGTGDIQLTLTQKIPVTAALVITTPQEVALLDARKGFEMFRKMNIPLLGLIENMGTHICDSCGHAESIFGEGGALRLAHTLHTVLLGQLPLSKNIREQADQGKPIVLASPHSKVSKMYHLIARTVAAQLSLQPKDYARKFPPILVQRNIR